MPLLRSLEIIRQQTPHKNLAQVLEDVHSRVQEGSTLADAMARHPRAFGELGTSIVRAGGEGGFMEEALDRLAKFTEQQDELKSRVIGALAYPMILLVLGTVIVNVLIIFFVPKFESLFQRLRERGELPAVTDWLLALSYTMQTYGIFVILGLVIVGYDHPHAAANGRRSHVARPPAAQSTGRQFDLPEPGGFPLLPRAGDAIDGRRADCPLAGNQCRLHG